MIISRWKFVHAPTSPIKQIVPIDPRFSHINGDEDLALIQPKQTHKKTQGWLVPNNDKNEGKSPAIRNYKPGESIEYLAIAYNVKFDKDKQPDLESQFVLYRDGQAILKGQPQIIDFKGVDNWNGIPIKGKIVLNDALPEGDYVLQLRVKDKRMGSKNEAVKALDFSISQSVQ
jgi:hypothetical protein